MRHLKNFNELNESNNTTPIDMRSIITNVLKSFKSEDELLEVFSEEDDIAYDVYYVFIDAKSIVELPEDEIQAFADNMGVGGEEDNLSAILNKMYKDKHSRNLRKDINICIDELKDYIDNKKNEHIQSAKSYLTELEKFKINL